MTHQKDPTREHRIYFDVIVDCYDEYEQNMGWYYYFAENLSFPVPAIVELQERGGTKKPCAVEIVSVTSDEDRPLTLGVCEKGSSRVINISPKDIHSVAAEDEAQLDIFNDWCYYHDCPLIEGVG